MSKFVKDAATSPTVPNGQQLFYCTVTCCNKNSCKPSTILKGAGNPYYCPYRQVKYDFSSNGYTETYDKNNANVNGSYYTESPESTPVVPSNYITNPFEHFYVSQHGCFRRSVPTMPLFLAMMFCILNLILPGLGTLLASFTILFGCNTEYGPKSWLKAFIIGIIASILQILTAIIVFGWVWSIMWGVVFIKNSLRYGNKRDLYTITLC